MKVKSFLAMMMAACAMVVGTVSCDDEDEDKSVAVADWVAGSYTGMVSTVVMGSTSTDTVTYIVEKKDDSSIKFTTPASGSGTMKLPSLTVDNLSLTETSLEGVKVYTAKSSSVSGLIMVDEQEKTYTFNDIAIAADGKTITISYSLQYGKMPVAMVTSFKGDK